MKTKMQLKRILKGIFLSLVFLAVTLAAPAQSWTNRYDGPAHAVDKAYAVAVDTGGNAVVAGVAFNTNGTTDKGVVIKYSGAGAPLWTNFSDTGTSAVAVDGSGNIFVTGEVTAKYSGAGVLLWTNRYVAPEDWFHSGVALVLDPAGNVLVTGGLTKWDGITFQVDWLTIKYSNAGLPLWTNRYGTAGSADWARHLAVDGNGNVIVAGDSANNMGGGTTATTIKYSAAGAPLWTNVFQNPVDGLAVDINGNAFVAVHAWNGVNLDCATIKYSNAGLPLWTNLFNGPANGEDVPVGVAVDSAGNVIVAGYSWTGSSYDYLTIKYSGNGVPMWANYYDGSANGTDFVRALAVGAGGNVFVTGTSEVGPGYIDCVTIAYSSGGEALWTNRYDNAPNTPDNYSNEDPRDMVVDGSGNVIVTGSIWGSDSMDDFLTIKYAAPELPSLNIQRLANSVILSWTNAAFGLQSAPSITGTFTDIPGTASPYTNTLSGGQRFFRLAQ